MPGLIHIYCGDGKGKTTASVGLAIRAAGAGKRVLFVQFFKRGNSSECTLLRTIPNLETKFCEKRYGFFKNMDEETRTCARYDYSALFEEAAVRAANGIDLLVFDEIISACNHGMIQESNLLNFLKTKPEQLEVVLTGRNPSDDLVTAADYVTEMRKIKHPYDEGIKARQGIEF